MSLNTYSDSPAQYGSAAPNDAILADFDLIIESIAGIDTETDLTYQCGSCSSSCSSC